MEPVQYDRAGELTPAETTEVAYLARRRAQYGHWPRRTLAILQRLRQPVVDVLAVTGGTKRGVACAVTAVLVLEMHARQRTFWAWTPAEWIETLGTSEWRFAQRFPISREARQHLMAVSYLLCGFEDLAALGPFDRLGLVWKVFGRERVDDAIERVMTTAIECGYQATQVRRTLPRAVSEALLANRSPRLQDLTAALLGDLRQRSTRHVRESVGVLSRALFRLGVTDRSLGHAPPLGRNGRVVDPTEGVAPEWVRGCRRWRETSTLGPKTRLGYYVLLLKAGRWLAHAHPDVVSPEGWTRELAAEYVAIVDRLTIGEWVHTERLRPERIGKPLSAKAKAHHLAALGTLFRDSQEWGWIPRRFDPRRCFAAPRSIRDQLVPNPRVIADDAWAKLLWAGLNLTEPDLPRSCLSTEHYYPLLMVRAVALVWLFAGLRVDEIRRLRGGCVRWHRRGGEGTGSAQGRPEDAVCFLDVPVHKTGAAFTKPVDRVVGQAIEAWEAARPLQPALLDPKTGEQVQYLFAYRGHPVSGDYVNKTLIPVLCRKAGIPRHDARGTISSHRARATIASHLFNAREPLSLFELQAWLGHRSPHSTQHYAKLTPTKLARAYADAEYFARNLRIVTVLIDQEAVTRGAGDHPWKFYDLGHGYCTYDFFDQCPHRMACAKCAFYVPKGSSCAQVLEGKANLLRMLQEIPLTEDERAAVEDGVQAFDRLEAKLADVPTPAGPTPRQLGTGSSRPLPPGAPGQEAGVWYGNREEWPLTIRG